MNPALMNPNALAMLAMQQQMMGAPVGQPGMQPGMAPQPAPQIPPGLMVPPSPTASGRMKAAVKRGSSAKKSGGNARQGGAAK